MLLLLLPLLCSLAIAAFMFLLLCFMLLLLACPTTTPATPQLPPQLPPVGSGDSYLTITPSLDAKLKLYAASNKHIRKHVSCLTEIYLALFNAFVRFMK